MSDHPANITTRHMLGSVRYVNVTRTPGSAFVSLWIEGPKGGVLFDEHMKPDEAAAFKKFINETFPDEQP